MVFDAKVATSPLPQYNPQLVKAVSKRLDRALGQFDAPQLLQDQVYDTIEALLPTCTPTLIQVSRIRWAPVTETTPWQTTPCE